MYTRMLGSLACLVVMQAWLGACGSDGVSSPNDIDATMELPTVDPGADPGPATDPGVTAPSDTGPDSGKSPVGDPRQRLSPLSQQPLDFTPSVPPLDLPLARQDIQNLDYLLDRTGLALAEGAEAALLGGAFVAVPGDGVESFHGALEWLKNLYWNDGPMPVLVTADALANLFHLFFSQLLKNVEIAEFTGMLRAMLPPLVDGSLAQADALDGTLAEAARRNAAFFAVAAVWAIPDYVPPTAVRDLVYETVALMDAHERLAPNPILDQDCPEACDPCVPDSQAQCNDPAAACACEDFSQYVPRGHYTQTKDLWRYFMAMMWLGRIPLRIQFDMETFQAVLATDLTTRTTVPWDGADVPLADLWLRIYKVTAFFAGNADDLTFHEYDTAIRAVLGDDHLPQDLLDPAKLAALRTRLRELRRPAILSNFVSVLLDATEATQGWRFMGQRFAPDSYVLGRMVIPEVGADITTPEYAGYLSGCGLDTPDCGDFGTHEAGRSNLNCVCYAGIPSGPWGVCRLLPRGLDVMSVLGSARADALLAADERYCNLRAPLDDLKAEFADYTEDDWVQNAYWAWLHALRPLLEDFGAGYPTFMQQDAWKTKSLATALASWAQLRHDTILYVKQSYTPGAGGGMPPAFAGYVEPVPRAFARLAFLASFVKDGLAAFDALPEAVGPVLDNMAALSASLADIAVKELTGVALAQGDQDLIEQFPRTYIDIVVELAKAGSDPEALEPEDPWSGGGPLEHEMGGDGFLTPVVADVHTDGNTGKVLEVATGRLDWAIVVHRSDDGPLVASVGPIFSYYEFDHPMSDRLTDEAWREILATDPPARPAWTDEMFR